MAFAAAKDALRKYRLDHIGGLLGESKMTWFTDTWGSLKSMLSTFSSDSENKEISGSYATGTSEERVPSHIKLDYVCGMRREVRKQYFSGESGIYTDVTPFKHGIMSAHLARIFDDALGTVITRKAK